MKDPNVDEYCGLLMDESVASPIIRMNWKDRTFLIEWTNVATKFATRSLKTTGNITLGEANIKWMHELLDEFIQKQIKEVA